MSRSACKACLILLAVLFGTHPVAAPASPDEPVAVTVSILPQAWFAERIGGDRVEVNVLVGPGESPASFDPSARRMAALQESELLFLAGVPFERALLPRLAARNDAPRLAGSALALESAGKEPATTHDHGHHHDDGLDPHSWLDPAQAADMADSLCAALCRLRPADRDGFHSRLEAVKTELADLDRQIAARLAPCRGREFFVFHPAFGHFARAYGLVQVAIEIDGHEPGARHLAEVIEQAREHGARAIIVQPQFSRKSAEAVARSLGVETVALDPLAQDYDTNLLHIADTLAGLLRTDAPTGGDR